MTDPLLIFILILGVPLVLGIAIGLAFGFDLGRRRAHRERIENAEELGWLQITAKVISAVELDDGAQVVDAVRVQSADWMPPARVGDGEAFADMAPPGH